MANIKFKDWLATLPPISTIEDADLSHALRSGFDYRVPGSAIVKTIETGFSGASFPNLVFDPFNAEVHPPEEWPDINGKARTRWVNAEGLKVARGQSPYGTFTIYFPRLLPKGAKGYG